MSEQYYEERAKEFYELKLGSMTMNDLNTIRLLVTLVMIISTLKRGNTNLMRRFPGNSKR